MDGLKYLIVDAGVRYWEDATINGVEDEFGTLTPFAFGDRWRPVIDLESGTIIEWPEGAEADIHFKVCDDGEYWLSKDGKSKDVKKGGYYVPDEYLCHGAIGYGDYIIMKVDGSWKIANYRKPHIDVKDFAGDGGE